MDSTTMNIKMDSVIKIVVCSILMIFILGINATPGATKERRRTPGQIKALKALIEKYIYQVDKMKSEQIVKKLSEQIVDLPDKYDENGWYMIYVMVDTLGTREYIDAKDILMNYIREINKLEENSPYVLRTNFRKMALSGINESLIRIEMSEQNIHSSKKKYIYLMEKINRERMGLGPLFKLMRELPPGIIIPEMVEILEGDDEYLKRMALHILADIKFNKVQDKLIEFMETEIKKKDFGLYIEAQHVIVMLGDSKSFKFIKDKLNNDNPKIRELSIRNINRLHDRKVINDKELKEALTPMLKDKDDEVSSEARSVLNRMKFAE